MQFSIDTRAFTDSTADCIILPIAENHALLSAVQVIDKQTNNTISKLLRQGHFTGKIYSSTFLYDLIGLPNKTILLVGLGDLKTLTTLQYCQIIQTAARTLLTTKIKRVLNCLLEVPLNNAETLYKLKLLVRETAAGFYLFTQLKSNPAPVIACSVMSFYLTEKKLLSNANQVLKQSLAIIQGIEFTKNMANLPANYCTPSYLGAEALQLAKQYKSLKTSVLDEKAIRKLGMGSFLAVTAGSKQPPRLITLEYQGAAKQQQPIVLVGKGITFDSGGISLKPAPDMDFMKYDMCGAASVLGTIKAVCEMKLPLNVVGIIPTCENLPDGQAVKPGDVVTSMSKQTIEILNTDAEGRLILCDALTYAERFKPACVIDIATLTGAVAIALGTHTCGLFTQNEQLATELLHAGNESFDRTWRMPLWDDYQDVLESNFADVANVGDRFGGSITAACFLSRFTKAYPWAHLDIAGIAYRSGKDKGATGRPVSLLSEFLIQQAKKR